MSGYFVFSGDKSVGFSTGDKYGLNVFLDILTDTFYYTDGSSIYAWEGDEDAASLTYTWRSGKVRVSHELNLGAGIVQADTYNDVVFKLYADGVLKHTETVADNEPFRLPGGYLSDTYEIELIGTDVVTGVQVAESIFELAKG